MAGFYVTTKTKKNKSTSIFLSDITQVIATKGQHKLEYKSSKFQHIEQLDFLPSAKIKTGLNLPPFQKKPRGVAKEKKQNILKQLRSIIPKERVLFWENLPCQE